MLELTAFLSGALIMVLEMVGARVLAPHVGTSAVVWTGLIGVVLACLALGAWAGGRFADKKLSRDGLGLVLAGAGLGTVLTAFFHNALGSGIVENVGNIYLAATAAALGLFAVPAFFFGMVSPYIIRLRIAKIATAGATVGRLYALSTAGSILGTFLGGFVLISFFSGTSILWGVALFMQVLSLCNAPKNALLRILLLFISIMLAAQDTLYGQWLADKGANRLVESPYNTIRITEGKDRAEGNRPVRLMATDPGYSQSGMYMDAPAELYFAYTRYYALGPHFVPHARKVLMLGGGGYSVPKWLLGGLSNLDAAALDLTVVELDPAMTRTARRWFELKDDPRLSVRHEDARIFLNQQQGEYDLVFVDVFNSHYSVPFQMGTIEAARAMRRATAPNGALLMNVISAVEGPDGRLFQGIYKALLASFAEVRVYCVNGTGRPRDVQNLMLVAFPEPRAEVNTADAGAEARVQRMLRTRYAPLADEQTPALRDDFAPVERYALMLLR